MRSRLAVAALVLVAVVPVGCSGKSEEEKRRELIKRELGEFEREVSDPTSREARSSPEFIKFRAATLTICGEAVEENERTGEANPATADERAEVFERLAKTHQDVYRELSALNAPAAAFGDFTKVTEGYLRLGGGETVVVSGIYPDAAKAARKSDDGEVKRLVAEAERIANEVDRAAKRIGIAC